MIALPSCALSSWEKATKGALYTVEPGYIEHPREGGIGLMLAGFVIFAHLLRQTKSKANENPFNIAGIHYIPCSI